MKVSVIVPVYNKCKYLHSLLSDLSEQSFSDYECLLIDDGSTDGSAEICDDISKKDNRFKVYHLDNGGVSKARNFGLDISQGEYITFIDADDRVHSRYIENLYNCIIENDVDFVISGHEKFWENSDRTEHSDISFKGIKSVEEIMPFFADTQRRTGIFGYCWSKIFRKNLSLDTYFDENLKLAEDFDFYLKIYPKVKNIYFDTKYYYRYLQMADNSSVESDEKIDYYNQLIINIRYRDFLKNLGFYSGENKIIVDEMISNYVYFTLFYSPVEEMAGKMSNLAKCIEQNELVITGKTFFQKWTFLLLKYRRDCLMRLTFKLYRNIRCIYRKIKILAH